MRITTLFLLLLFSSAVFAQDQHFNLLKTEWDRLLNSSEEQKMKQHNNIIRAVESYVNKGGKGEFNKLENFKELFSSDSSLRIVSWYFQKNKMDFVIGGHLFYQKESANGIPMKVSKRLEPKDGKIARDTTYAANDWPRAWYYKMIEKKDRFDRTYYTLIGWIPKNRLSQQKTVDVIWFKKSQVYFGAPIFDRDGKREHRLLYEYGAQNTMRLSYQTDKDQIIMDHLSPPGAEYHGIYEYYGPDFSYDAFRWENDRWLYYPDIDIDKGLNKKKSDFDKKGKILKETPVYSPKGE